MMKQVNDIKLEQIYNNNQIVKELKKGNFVLYADKKESKNNIDILTQDIVYYDKKNNRIRILLGHCWTENQLFIKPNYSIMSNENLSKNTYKSFCTMTGIDIKNYDWIFSVKPRYITIIMDSYRDIPNMMM